MFNIIIIGPAGSGKGVQSEFISKHLGIPNISTGVLLRQIAQQGTDVSEEVDKAISKGDLISDELMFNILVERLEQSDCSNGFILDGFPRTVEQAKKLDKKLAETGEEIDKILVLSVPNEVVIKRISGRFQCKSCKKIYNKYYGGTEVEGVCDACGSKEFFVRSDDIDINSIKKRLDIYENMSKSIIDYYNEKGLIYFLNGERIPEQIFQDIKNILDN